MGHTGSPEGYVTGLSPGAASPAAQQFGWRRTWRLQGPAAGRNYTNVWIHERQCVPGNRSSYAASATVTKNGAQWPRRPCHHIAGYTCAHQPHVRAHMCRVPVPCERINDQTALLVSDMTTLSTAHSALDAAELIGSCGPHTRAFNPPMASINNMKSTCCVKRGFATARSLGPALVPAQPSPLCQRYWPFGRCRSSYRISLPSGGLKI